MLNFLPLSRPSCDSKVHLNLKFERFSSEKILHSAIMILIPMPKCHRMGKNPTAARPVSADASHCQPWSQTPPLQGRILSVIMDTGKVATVAQTRSGATNIMDAPAVLLIESSTGIQLCPGLPSDGWRSSGPLALRQRDGETLPVPPTIIDSDSFVDDIHHWHEGFKSCRILI